MEFNQLEQLVAIAKYGTISKAAEVLHLSQPALTRSMQHLEPGGAQRKWSPPRRNGAGAARS